MSNFKTDDIFGNITSEIFSFIKVSDSTDNNYTYIITYITQKDSSYYLLIKKWNSHLILFFRISIC